MVSIQCHRRPHHEIGVDHVQSNRSQEFKQRNRIHVKMGSDAIENERFILAEFVRLTQLIVLFQNRTSFASFRSTVPGRIIGCWRVSAELRSRIHPFPPNQSGFPKAVPAAPTAAAGLKATLHCRGDPGPFRR